jgi:hypothetical protein
MAESIMAAWSSILQKMIQARIGAPGPSVARQALPSAVRKPAVRNPKINSGRDGSLLPAEKIAALLRLYGSKEFRGRRRVLIGAVAAMWGSGVSRQTIYLARRGIMSERTRKLLSRALTSIERGEVTFHRVGQQWRGEYHDIPPATPQRVLDVDRDDPAAIIQKINDHGRRPKTVPVDLGVITINVCTGW